VIVVAGEALIDLVIEPDGTVAATLGGAPYNTARAAALLDGDVRFVGRLSSDRFGSLLAAQLDRDGVKFDESVAVAEPTTLAAAEVDDDGAASYRFYFAGTAAPQLSAEVLASALAELAVDGPNGIFFTGGLGLVLEPMASTLFTALGELRDETVVLLDLNCRPVLVEDRSEFIARVRGAVERADIVKVSDDDLGYLAPDADPVDAARELIGAGARIVVVTAGSSETIVVANDQTMVIPVPPLDGDVIDTIGAGDTFVGALLAWWSAAGFCRADVSIDNVAQAVVAGHAASAVVVTRRGADPPRREDLHIDWPGS
jgi:fructokinase